MVSTTGIKTYLYIVINDQFNIATHLTLKSGPYIEEEGGGAGRGEAHQEN